MLSRNTPATSANNSSLSGSCDSALNTMVKGDKLPSMVSTLEDSGKLCRLEKGLFDVVSDVQRWRTQGGQFCSSLWQNGREWSSEWQGIELGVEPGSEPAVGS